MKIIGLTGGIASGKSTVAAVFKKMGAIILDADQIAREVVLPHQPAWEDIVKLFGSEVLNEDLSLNRQKIGSIVFSNPAALKELNRITHPRIYQYFKDALEKTNAEQPHSIVILDIPLLYEANLDKLCDQVIVVWVDRETQIKRLMARNNLNREEAISRIDAQMSLDEKAKLADYVIDNRGSIMETIEKAANYFNNILEQD